MELASKWTEKAKTDLGLTDEQLIPVRQSLIDAGKLKNDLADVPAVTPDSFKDLLVAIKQSMAAATEATKPEAKAPAAAPAASDAAALFDDASEAVAELQTKFEVFASRADRQASAMAQGHVATGNLLEQIATGLAGLSTQLSQFVSKTTTELAEIRQSMSRPGQPKAVLPSNARAAVVPSPNEERVGVTEQRRAFKVALDREIAQSQAAFQGATDGAQRKQAEARLKQLSQAANMFSSHPADLAPLYAEYNIPSTAA